MFIDSVYVVRFLVWGAVILLGWSAFAALLQSDLFAPFLAKWRGITRFQKGLIVSVLLAVTAWAGIKPGIGGDGGDDTGGSSTNDVTQVEGDASNTNDVGWIGGDLGGTNDVGQVGGETTGGEDDDGGSDTGDETPTDGSDATAPLMLALPHGGSRITANDYASLFVLQSAGTNEVFDFSAPDGALVATNWVLHGAATAHLHWKLDDWTFPFGPSLVTNLTAFACGVLMPDVSDENVYFAPLAASLGVVPKANWDSLDETNRPSIYWQKMMDDNSVVCTWQNVLLDRIATNPVSFQAEFRAGGEFIFRYDLSRLAADEILTNAQVIVASGCGDGFVLGYEPPEPPAEPTTNDTETAGAEQTDALPRPPPSPVLNRRLTSLRFRRLEATDRWDTDRDNDGLTTEEELFDYGTNHAAADSDYDGLPDDAEIAAGLDPLSNDTDGDGLVDGSDPEPSVPHDFIDEDGDGIDDSYERHWFGDTNVVDDATVTKEDGFALETEILAGINPTNDAPKAVTYVTNSLVSWKLFGAFAAQLPQGANPVLWRRTFRIGKTSKWQQYFVSAAPDSAAGWMLEGMRLEWEDSNGNSGSLVRSASGDSWKIPLSPTNETSSVTLRLRATGRLVRSVAPLYLIAYRPEFGVNGGNSFTGDNGVKYSVFTDGSASEIGIAIDRTRRPCHAAVGADETDMEVFEQMSGDGGDIQFEGDERGGSLRVSRPGMYRFPDITAKLSAGSLLRGALRGSGDDGWWFVILSPRVGWSCEGQGCSWGGLGYDWTEDVYTESTGYPYDTSCLRRLLHHTYGGGWTCDGSFYCETGFGTGNGVWYEIRGNRGTIYVGGVEVWSGELDHIHDHACGGDSWDEEGECCCTGCKNGDCSGLEKPEAKSMKFRIPMGSPSDDFISGFVYIDTSVPIMVSKDSFQIMMHPEADWRECTRSGARCIVCNDRRGRFVELENITGGVRATVKVTATTALEHTWEITNVGGADTVRFRQISRLDNVMLDQTFHYANGNWSLFDNIAQVGETLVVEGGVNDPYSGGVKRETRTKRDANGNLLNETITESERFGECDNAVIRETYREEYDGYSWTWREMDYWDDPSHPARHGKPRLVYGTDRAWCYTDYDEAGRILLRLEQRNGSNVPSAFPSASGNEIDGIAGIEDATATVYSYTPLTGDDRHADDAAKARVETKYVVRGGDATLIGRTWRRYTRQTVGGFGAVKTETWRAATGWSDWNDWDNASSYELVYSDEGDDMKIAQRGGVIEAMDENGVRTEGVFEDLVDTIRITTRKYYGTTELPTYTVTVKDAYYANVLSEETYLSANDVLIDRRVSTYDDQNRLRTTTYFDGTAETNSYSCCRLLWTTDREGRKTLRSAVTGEDHLYWADEEVWLAEVSTNGDYRVTQHFVDGLGRETNTVTRIGRTPGEFTVPNPAGAPEVDASVVTTEYPYGGSSYEVRTDARGVVTETCKWMSETSEETSVSTVTNGRTVFCDTTTAIRGGRTTSRREWDGCRKWTENTRITDYDGYGCRVAYSVTDSSDCGAVTNSITTSDLLGRTVRTETPLGVTEYTYDGSSSRIVSSVYWTRDVTREATYVYDECGERVGVTQDGTTRRSDTTYEELSNEWWKVTREEVCVEGEDDGDRQLTVTREQLTGLGGEIRARTMTEVLGGASTAVVTRRGTVGGETEETSLSSATGERTARLVFGMRCGEESPDGMTAYGYDPLGRMAFKAKNATLERYAYTVENDLAATWVRTNATCDAAVTEHAYDLFGRRVATVDAAGGVTRWEYDAVGNAIAESGATYPTRSEYDTMNRRIALWTNRSSNEWDVTRWAYDPATGLCTSKTYADGSATTYEYTSDGLLETTRYAGGHWVRNVYDAKRQVVETRYDDTGDTTYVRDALGRETSAANSLAAYAYLRDRNGIATNETATIGGRSHTLRRELDGQGRIATFGIENSGRTSSLTFGYRQDGRIGSVTNGDVTVDYAYSDDGYDTGYTLAVQGGATFVRTLVRDPCRRDLVTAVHNSFGADFNYSYDALSRIVSRGEGTGEADRFAYDPLNQVIAETHPALGTNDAASTAFAYDNIGNLTSALSGGVTNLFGANPLNQYVSIDANGRMFEPTYDADGNLTSFGTLTCQYDSASRLSMVYTNGALYAANYYDHMGRRVRMVARDISHTFVYDGWNIVLEVSERGGFTNRVEYFWGKDLSGTIGGAGGTGGLLYLKRNGEIYVPIYDAYGDIVEYRAADGTLVASYRYDAFGRIIAQSGPMSRLFRFRHATKCFDWQTGIYYYGNRYYLPQLRRWLNRDPLEESGGLNLYVFCKNNGLSLGDLLGLAHFEVIKLKRLPAILNYSCFGAIIGAVPAAILDLGLADALNIEILHEHLFYDDGSNVGYGPDGYMRKEDKSKYSRRDFREYDDCIMHEAEALATPPPYSLIGYLGVYKYNCQDYADTLRSIYDRIKDWPSIICKCTCGKK